MAVVHRELSPLSSMGVMSCECVSLVWPWIINFSTCSLTLSTRLTLALLRRHLATATEDNKSSVTKTPKIIC